MRLLFIALSAFFFTTSANAQVRDSVFLNYESYATYVDQKIMNREFKQLILDLGGRDEYSSDQLTQVNEQLLGAFSVDFQNSTVFRREDLGGNTSQEGRMYWTGENYAYFYAILHDRGDELVVINFSLNSNIGAIMSKF